MRIALSFICFLFVIFQHTYSVDIKCSYSYGTFSNTLASSYYYCNAASTNVNSHQDVIVDKISGVHQNGKDNDDVLGFAIHGTNIPYFLKNLETHFKNLKAIALQSSHLKEIHQSDLMPFPNLLGLFLGANDIEIIEEGLFDYNPNLIEIRLYNNKIVHIHANVFDNLSKLSYLLLNPNTCINKDYYGVTAVKDLIQEIKSQSKCKNTEYSNLESKITSLKNSISSLNSQAFKNQLAGVKAELKNSKYAEHFTRRIEALEAIKIVEPTTTTTQNPTTELPTTTTQNSTTELPTTPKPCICDISNQTNCAKVSDLKPILDEIKALRETGQDDPKTSQNETFLNLEDKIQFIEDSLVNFQASTAKRLQRIEDDQKLSEFRLSKKIDSVARKFDALEGKLEKILEALNNKV